VLAPACADICALQQLQTNLVVGGIDARRIMGFCDFRVHPSPRTNTESWRWMTTAVLGRRDSGLVVCRCLRSSSRGLCVHPLQSARR